MHDPMTVAFDIKRPWRSAPSQFSPKGYRPTWITIWHVDPERDAGKRGTRADDTCGWFRPPTAPEERARMHKLGEHQYSTIFEKLAAVQNGKDYARVCFEPTPYDVIYWAWRSIKHEHRPRGPWQYGCRLTRGELEKIYSLSASPIDNFRLTIAGIDSAEKCGDLFVSLYKLYLRHHRPWYREPRWHLWHWRVQIHPWQALRRWLLSRCAHCGKRFPYGYSPVSHGRDSKRPRFMRGEEGVYHSECSGHGLARSPAENIPRPAQP